MLPEGYQSFLPRELTPQLREYVDENTVVVEASVEVDILSSSRPKYINIHVSVTRDFQLTFDIYTPGRGVFNNRIEDIIGSRDGTDFPLQFPNNGVLRYRKSEGIFTLTIYDDRTRHQTPLIKLDKPTSAVLLRKLIKLNEDMKRGLFSRELAY